MSKAAGLLGSWGIAIGSMVDIFIINLDSCLAGNCTTTNPVKIALGVFLLPHIWILLAASISLEIAASISGNSAISAEEEGGKALN